LRAARGRAFETAEELGWRPGAGDWTSVLRQVEFKTPSGRRRRPDLVVEIDDGTTVVIETKATDWDVMAPHRIRPNVQRHVKQLLRYVEQLDRNQGVHPALVYPNVPADEAKRAAVEEIAYAAFVQVVWRDL